MCGMTIFEVMWRLPVSVAYQIYYTRLANKGIVLVTGESDDTLLERLRRCQT
jgi:hypothetical protein